MTQELLRPRRQGPDTYGVSGVQLLQPHIDGVLKLREVAVGTPSRRVDHNQEPGALAEPAPGRLYLRDHLGGRKLKVRAWLLGQNALSGHNRLPRKTPQVTEAGILKAALLGGLLQVG